MTLEQILKNLIYKDSNGHYAISLAIISPANSANYEKAAGKDVSNDDVATLLKKCLTYEGEELRLALKVLSFEPDTEVGFMEKAKRQAHITAINS